MKSTGTIIALLCIVVLWILWIIAIYIEQRNPNKK